MEPAMTDQPRVPDPETAKRLLVNLRRTHLEMEEFNLEIAEITTRLEHNIRQQRLKRVRQSQACFDSRITGL